MKFRTKLCSAGVTVGMLAGSSLAVLPQSVAAEPVELPSGTTVNQFCYGADDFTRMLLGIIPEWGNKLDVSTIVTPDPSNPTALAAGASAPVAFDVQMDLPQSLIDLAIGALGVNELGLEDFNFVIAAEGGASGDQLTATPTSGTIGLDPVSIPSFNAGGNIDVENDAIATVFEVDAFTFTIRTDMVDEETNEIVSYRLYLDCAPNPPTIFGTINHTTGPITGVVTNAANQPITNAVVDLRDATGLNRVAPITRTDSNGSYSFNNLEPGYYKAYVRPVANQYLGSWFGQAQHRSGAAPILVVGGGSSADVVLPATNYGISGHVNAGGPAADAVVDLRDASGLNRIALARTDANGDYSFENLLPGTYSVYFRAVPDYEGQWFNGAPGRSGRTLIDISGGSATNVDVSLSCIVCNG